MRNIAFFLFILLLTPNAWADSSWDRCVGQEECIKVRKPCGSVGAINRNFEKENAESVRQFEMLMQCRMLTEEERHHNESLRAVCHQSVCQLTD
jgi:hypothetical protein